ncbi:MAG TPA: A/G-specific adenine glycosylase [Thermoanaerobaculia bacterium]|nr:A/G-specific adenine glycosylase [Thermoanaerobaculia bacterium]
MKAPELAAAREALAAWYARHRRALPWRATSDPYAVLLSEVMLQQTRVATAVPYFERFLARFPTVDALAAASEEEVLALWSGLGYYRRARQLHAAARRIAAAGFPPTARELAELPGVGPYTAAAVASIAFGEPVAAVDGNVMRVIARLVAWDGPIERAASRRAIAAAAGALLDSGRPGESNQALMELGATLCRPAGPLCEACPVAAVCAGRGQGIAGELPRRGPRRPPRRERWVVARVERAGRILLFRRGAGERLLAGLWELPQAPAGAGAEAALAERYGGRFRLGEPLGRLRHAITTRALEVEVHAARWEAEGDRVAEGPEAAWLSPAEAATGPLTALARKALALGGGEPAREPES